MVLRCYQGRDRQQRRDERIERFEPDPAAPRHFLHLGGGADRGVESDYGHYPEIE